MKYLIASIRLLALLITIIISLIIVIIFYPITPQQYWMYVIKYWAKIMLFFVGVKIETIGKFPTNYLQKNCMIISNHISWLDIPVLYSLYFVSFVSRAEVKNWPILNLLFKCSGTIFIDRSRKKDILTINKIVSQRLMDNLAIGFFPEGKTSDGKGVLPFKAPLLQAGIIAKSKILPLALKYYSRSTVKPAYEITYAGDITLWQTIKSTLLLNGICVKIIALPQFNAIDFANRREMARELYKEISAVYNRGY